MYIVPLIQAKTMYQKFQKSNRFEGHARRETISMAEWVDDSQVKSGTLNSKMVKDGDLVDYAAHITTCTFCSQMFENNWIYEISTKNILRLKTNFHFCTYNRCVNSNHKGKAGETKTKLLLGISCVLYKRPKDYYPQHHQAIGFLDFVTRLDSFSDSKTIRFTTQKGMSYMNMWVQYLGIEKCEIFEYILKGKQLTPVLFKSMMTKLKEYLEIHVEVLKDGKGALERGIRVLSLTITCVEKPGQDNVYILAYTERVPDATPITRDWYLDVPGSIQDLLTEKGKKAGASTSGGKSSVKSMPQPSQSKTGESKKTQLPLKEAKVQNVATKKGPPRQQKLSFVGIPSKRSASSENHGGPSKK